MDSLLLLSAYGLAKKSVLVKFVAIAGATYLPYAFLLCVLWLFATIRGAQEKLYFFAVTAIALILSRGIMTEIIRFFYHRQRPFEMMPDVTALIAHNGGNAFPSGHATFFFALAAAVFFYSRRVKGDAYRITHDAWSIWLFGFAAFIGIARVAVGVHWPSDILAGAAIGIISAWVANALIYRKPQESLA
ncbi:MAG: phosphatase PAP2 family protein [Candidatus Liptonbacteria bacterium]|nr:phosphatase PAP2 family protein [Candidatus Liptonbacteria bacterium]